MGGMISKQKKGTTFDDVMEANNSATYGTPTKTPQQEALKNRHFSKAARRLDLSDYEGGSTEEEKAQDLQKTDAESQPGTPVPVLLQHLPGFERQPATNWKKYLLAGAAFLFAAISAAAVVLVTTFALASNPLGWGVTLGLIVGAATGALASAICFGVAAVKKALANRESKSAFVDGHQEAHKKPSEKKQGSSYVNFLANCFKLRADPTPAAEAAALASEDNQQTYAPAEGVSRGNSEQTVDSQPSTPSSTPSSRA